MAERIRVYGATWCSDTARARHFLAAHGVAYEWYDVDKSLAARALVDRTNAGTSGGTLPTIFFPDGSWLAEPTNAQLAEKLGLPSDGGNKGIDIKVR